MVRYEPKISIVIPVYNGGGYFEPAIESALAQTYKNTEIVVVNDGSNDNGQTDAIARRYEGRIKYISQPNKGVAGALNTAVQHLTGEIFTWLSHDDLYLPEKTSSQLEFFLKLNRHDGIVFSDFYLMDEKGEIWHEAKLDHARFMKTPMIPLLTGGINGCTLFMPAALLREAGPFDESLRYTQDYALWNKILARHEFFHHAQTVIKYRVHTGQGTNKPGAAVEGDALWVRMLESRSETERVQLFGSTKNFFVSMADFLDKTPYKKAAAFAHSRIEPIVSNTLVSVVVPFFNEIDKLMRAARSVLSQSHEKIELILVDDGSDDDIGPVRALAQADPRVRLLRQPNAGPGAARNRGIVAATGDYIAFLDSDDLFLPQKIASQLEAMQDRGILCSHTSYNVVFPELFSKLGTIHSGSSDQIYPNIIAECSIATPTVMMHRSVVSAGFRFPECSFVGEDVLAWIWLAQRHPIVGLDQPLATIEWSVTSAAVNIEKTILGLEFVLGRLECDQAYPRHSAEIVKLRGLLESAKSIMESSNAGGGVCLNGRAIQQVFHLDRIEVDRALQKLRPSGLHSLSAQAGISAGAALRPRPKILFVCFPYSIHAARWTSLFDRSDWDCHIFPSQASNAVHEDFANVTLWPVQNIPLPEHARSLEIGALRGGPKSAAGSGELAAYLSRVIEQERFDVVQTLEFQHAGYLMLDVLDQIKVPPPKWIATNYGADIVLFGEQPEHRSRIRDILARCDYYSSECQRDVRLARALGFEGDVLPVVPNSGGFDLSAIAASRLPGKTSARRIIAVKGYQHFAGRALTALKALELCEAELSPYEIKVFAPFPEVRDEAERLKREKGFRISCLPEIVPHEEILKLHGSARISIAISIADGISTSLIEAMAMGSFPIQTSTACAEEWIEDGRSGFIVEPGNPALIAKRIAAALHDDVLVDGAAELNRRRIEAQCNNVTIKERVRRAYGEIVKA